MSDNGSCFRGETYQAAFARAPIDDGCALAMETARFQGIYNRVRPHQALGDRTPRDAYLSSSAASS